MPTACAGYKVCVLCRKSFPATGEHFNAHSGCGDGLHPRCKTCKNSTRRHSRAVNPEPHKAQQRSWSRKYHQSYPGLTNASATGMWSQYRLRPDDYLALCQNQEWRCAICRERLRWLWGNAIDHCHESGNVCGILCDACNLGIGTLKEDYVVLARAAEYVRKNKAKRSSHE